MKKLIILILLMFPHFAQADEFTYEGHNGFIHYSDLRSISLHNIISQKPEKRPWVWLMPAWLGMTESCYNDLINSLVRSGIAVVGLEIGVTFGSPKAVKFNEKFRRFIIKKYDLEDKPTLLLQSNGALSGIAWATQHPHRVKRIGMVYPVLDIETWPKLKFIIGDEDLINPVWKFAHTFPELVSYMKFINPELTLHILAKKKIPALSIHGIKDSVVPYKENARDMKSLYEKHGGKFELLSVRDLDHEISPRFQNNKRLINFLKGK